MEVICSIGVKIRKQLFLEFHTARAFHKHDCLKRLFCLKCGSETGIEPSKVSEVTLV
jgi:hypothetical protein